MAGIGAPTAGPPGQRNDISAGPDAQTMLNTYIHNYFVKEGQHELAKNLRTSSLKINNKIASGVTSKDNANGMGDGDDGLKGDFSNGLPGNQETFMLDWWGIFWDFWLACHSRSDQASQAAQFVANSQARMRSQMHSQMFQPGGMMGNRMNITKPLTDTHHRALHNNNTRGISLPGNRMMQNPMHRDGQEIDMNGQPRGQSPMGADNAPSPSKRPRLDGGPNFGGPGMGQLTRPGMGPIQNGVMAQNNMMLARQGLDPKGLPQGQNFGMPGQPGGNPADMVGNPNPLVRNGAPVASGGALADYQMQLMLLEQQNKRRLIIARQESNANVGPDGNAIGPGLMMQGPQLGAPAMSPRGSRTGQSPGPNDPAKRGNSMGTNSPRPDGSMPPGRGSPGAVNFDPSSMNHNMGMPFMPNMPNMPNIPNMPNMQNMQNPNGAMMRTPNGQPVFTAPNGNGVGFAPAQLEMIRNHNQALAARGMANSWPGGPHMPGQMPMGAPMPGQQPGQQPPTDGSQPRNNMGPPQAPPSANNNANSNHVNNANNATANSTNNANNAVRNQTSSPQQPPAPPTPSTTNKAAPKKKDTKDTKKKITKKGANTTGATPTSTADTEDPSVPTPQTPATPQNAQSFNLGNRPGQGGAPNKQALGTGMQPGHQMGQQGPGPLGMPMGQDNGAGVHQLGGMDESNDQVFNMDFADVGAGDVIAGFDFDYFITDPSVDFDTNNGYNSEPVQADAADV